MTRRTCRHWAFRAGSVNSSPCRRSRTTTPNRARARAGLAEQFLANAVTNPDQLRQKVAFALSQIFVTSINTIIWNGSMIPYEQMLMADAFTNYRQIMGDVTLSPTMGQYLDMANNAMGNPATGTIANRTMPAK